MAANKTSVKYSSKAILGQSESGIYITFNYIFLSCQCLTNYNMNPYEIDYVKIICNTVFILDALCCCQQNKVPYECLGYCMNVIAQGNEEVGARDAEKYDKEIERMKKANSNVTKYVPPEWFLVRPLLTINASQMINYELPIYLLR